VEAAECFKLMKAKKMTIDQVSSCNRAFYSDINIWATDTKESYELLSEFAVKTGKLFSQKSVL